MQFLGFSFLSLHLYIIFSRKHKSLVLLSIFAFVCIKLIHITYIFDLRICVVVLVQKCNHHDLIRLKIPVSRSGNKLYP